jgi:hypothetical protein
MIRMDRQQTRDLRLQSSRQEYKIRSIFQRKAYTELAAGTMAISGLLTPKHCLGLHEA